MYQKHTHTYTYISGFMCAATTLADTCSLPTKLLILIIVSYLCFCLLSVCCYCFLHILFLRQAVPVKKFGAGTDEKPRYAADDIEVLLSFACLNCCT